MLAKTKGKYRTEGKSVRRRPSLEKGKEKIQTFYLITFKSKLGNDENNKIYMYQYV